MYKNAIYTILRNEPLTDAVWRLVLEGDTQWITRPGQFVDIALEGRFLRRPISVCDADERTVTLIYKVVGEGTRQMAAMPPGARLDLGVPPLYGLAKALLAAGRRVTVVLGFNTAAEIFYADEFERLGCTTVVATADGSRGVKGFVTTAIAERVPDFGYFYACGPLPMLRALCDTVEQEGQLSFEERMGCGFGACMGCSCRTKQGTKRVCKEGPVFEKSEVIW